jgi:Holliday junction resolvasome RuvABC DNA-binding subunit
MPPRPLRNDEVADALERVADLLEAQDENPFRVRAWRSGAGSVRGSVREVSEILAEGGIDALDALPGIGKSLASAIAELVHTGRLRFLDRLEGEIAPEDLFTTVPGIGEELAARIHRELGIDTLEELELAAHDGRLATLAGFGARRVRAVREALAGMLSRSTRRRARRIRQAEAAAAAPPDRPDVATLLTIDAEYRRRAAAGELRRIAPRRFNPEGRAWLPILHAERDGWQVSAMFSNTARAHELGTTHDWVVLYTERDGHEDQVTVVTERHGALAGRRVVRGREGECQALYTRQA